MVGGGCKSTLFQYKGFHDQIMFARVSKKFTTNIPMQDNQLDLCQQSGRTERGPNGTKV